MTRSGSWAIWGWQMSHGIPALPYGDGPYPRMVFNYRQREPAATSPWCPIGKPGLLAGDVPLLSFEAVKRALTEQILAGHLWSIDEMEFGYIGTAAPGNGRPPFSFAARLAHQGRLYRRSPYGQGRPALPAVQCKGRPSGESRMPPAIITFTRRPAKCSADPRRPTTAAPCPPWRFSAGRDVSHNAKKLRRNSQLQPVKEAKLQTRIWLL